MSDPAPTSVPDMTQLPTTGHTTIPVQHQYPLQPQPLSTPLISQPPIHPKVIPSTDPASSTEDPTTSNDHPLSPPKTDPQLLLREDAPDVISIQEPPSSQSSSQKQPLHTDSDLMQDLMSKTSTDAEPIQSVTVLASVPQTPQVSLTFLLVSGRRRTMSFEPETTVMRVKELLWNAWPSEWQDVRPPAPSHLRILYLGKILQEEDTLSKLSFPIHIPSPFQSQPPEPQSRPQSQIQPTATIVHLSIRPYIPPTNDDVTKKKGRKRRTRNDDDTGGGAEVGEGGNRGADSAGCCAGCVIC